MTPIYPQVTLLDVEPIGHREGPAFVDYTDGTGELVLRHRSKVHPKSPNGERLHGLRKRAGLFLNEAANLLGLPCGSKVSFLEHGSATLSDEDWARVFAALEALPEVRQEPIVIEVP